MGAEVTTRRQLLASGVTGAGVLLLPSAAFARGSARPTATDLAVGARSTKLYGWAPAKPRGVVLFSTGHGSWPERYDRLIGTLSADGWAVLVPVHVDSMHHPDRDKFTLQASFGERLADMTATAAEAAQRYPGLPMVAVGHSFGTLIALCLAGGMAYIGPFRSPAVRAVLGFSSPGKIPGLIRPSAYQSVATPVMIVTGTADTVPGFVTDPADHLFAAETVLTDSYALVVDGADHVLVAGERLARAAAPARLFLHGYGLHDAAARRELAAWRPAAGDRWTVRKGKG